MIKLVAIVWLHFLRLWRYRYNLINMIVSNAMWVLLLILGVILFVPSEEFNSAVKTAYWTIACWSVISNFSSLVGGWTNFFISLGMVEEHLMRGISPFLVIGGRLSTATAVSVLTILFMGALIQSLFSAPVFELLNPSLALFGFIAIALQSLFYGLIVAALAMRISVSEQFLEILNFAIVGLLLVPMRIVPVPLKLLYLVVPYIAPTHLLKISCGSEDQSFLMPAIAISLIEAVSLCFLAYIVIRMTEEHLRKNGVRAIGFY